jgi:hypothetical protein
MLDELMGWFLEEQALVLQRRSAALQHRARTFPGWRSSPLSLR